jgi:hypothetical protein
MRCLLCCCTNRLEEMSKPKHSREPKQYKPKDDEKIDSSFELDLDVELVRDKEHQVVADKRKASISTVKTNNLTTAGNQPAQKPTTASAPAPTLAADRKEAILRYSSPSRELVTPVAELKSLPITVDAPSAVRSSLTLLKNKTPKVRRRLAEREVIEDQNAFEEKSLTSMSNQAHGSVRCQLQNSWECEQPLQRHENAPPIFEAPVGQLEDETNLWNKDNDSQDYDQSLMDEEAGEFDENTIQCPDCERRFAPEPFSRHVRICKKVFVNKRRVFDSSKKRIEAIPELKSLLDSKKRASKKSAPPVQQAAKSGKWKEQSLAFRAAMRAARGASMPADEAVQRVPYVDPSLIQCPNCQRRFNEHAAARHIPICRNILAKPSVLKKGSGSNATAITANLQASKTPMNTTKRGWN